MAVEDDCGFFDLLLGDDLTREPTLVKGEKEEEKERPIVNQKKEKKTNNRIRFL